MYGGTGRGRLPAVALVVAILGAVTACQQEDAGPGRARESVAPSSDDPGSADVQTADYEHWNPVYGEVRPATADDVESLRQRVADLNETSYTVMVPRIGFEIASAPDHVRVRFGEGTPDVYDLHLDPTVTTGQLLGPFVICSADDGSCVEVGKEGAEAGGQHMVNDIVDTIVLTSTTIVANQRALPYELDDMSFEEASFATLDSPSGTLDCLVSGGTPEDHARLEGSPVDLEADPLHRISDPEPLSTTCADEHGLLILLLPALVTPVVPYGAFEPEVPDGFDEHADPVPYGETASATPTPTSPGTDPDHMYVVLVAMAPIPAGEPLADAQMKGWFELHFVRGDEVVPGAVASTEGLDGVALEDIAEGEQITEDMFG